MNLKLKENFIGMIITVGHGDTVGAHWVSITRSPKCWKHNEAGALMDEKFTYQDSINKYSVCGNLNVLLRHIENGAEGLPEN